MGILQAAGGGGGSLQVTASNVSKSGSGFIGCGNPGSTGAPNLTIFGGSGDYSIEWSRVSGTPTYGPWVCSSTTAQNPTWHAPDPVCANATSSVETWKAEVTDNLSGQFGSASNTVTIIWIDTR